LRDEESGLKLILFSDDGNFVAANISLLGARAPGNWQRVWGAHYGVEYNYGIILEIECEKMVSGITQR
jgi:hypothetical protein